MRKNKILFSGIMFLVFMISTLIINSQDIINEPRWVTADVGLNMRDAPNLNAKKIGLIPYGEQVLLVEETGNRITISGATGKWSKITWKGKTGWVFGGFLAVDETTGETSGGSGQSADINTWKTYTNEKYGYSFRYPPGYTTGKCPKPCKSGKVGTERGGDYVFIQGYISEKCWPMISVAHYNTSFYNPPAGTGLYEWLREKALPDAQQNLPDGTIEISVASGRLEVVKVIIPKSPQAYSRWEIYYMEGGKIFMIEMQDVDDPAAVEFYNTWLSGFKP
jgi:uncharacterized protein YgiM (DUF1202 family)